jgi:hypothetical protein
MWRRGANEKPNEHANSAKADGAYQRCHSTVKANKRVRCGAVLAACVAQQRTGPYANA